MTILTLMVTITLMSTTLTGVMAQDRDPEISKVSGGWEAVWDFSHPSNFTLINTTIETGQLKLAKHYEDSVDDTQADLEAGTAFNVRVTPNGSLVLPFKSSSGFTEIGSTANVDSTADSYSAGWADYDNDGLQDLSVGVRQGLNHLYKNNGDGTFADVTATAGIAGGATDRNRAMVWGDYDNDGDLDLATSTALSLILWKNRNDGTFVDETMLANISGAMSTEGIAWTDYNNDGWLDLYVPRDGNDDQLWMNERNGTFMDNASAANVLSPTGWDGYLTTGDYNNDGWPDLLKSMENHGLLLYCNDKNGSFNNRTSQRNLTSATYQRSSPVFGDIDNDGYLDLYIADNGQDDLWVNEATGFWLFNTQIGLTENYQGRGVSMADYDNDGLLDIFVSNDMGEDLLWMNSGDGTFSNMAPSWAVNDNGPARGTTAADFDNDGDMDIFVARYGQADLLYRNDLDNEEFLKFRLIGSGDGHSNTAAIGTRVTLYEKGDPEVLAGIREVTSGSGFGSTESLEPIFGANRSKLYKAVVDFPGHDKVVIDDLQVPAYIKVSDDGNLSYLPINSHYMSGGNFTSRAHDLGSIVSWGTLNWSDDVPANTDIVIKTRTSPDASNWCPWSGEYNKGDLIKSPKDAYIQYWVELKSSSPKASPVLFNITIGYSKYISNGTATTEKLVFEPAALNTKFSSFGSNNGQSVAFTYSNDSGQTWKDVPLDGDLSSEAFHNITLRVDLATNNEVVTPSLQHMKVLYTRNNLPYVSLVAPAHESIVAPDVTLEWDGTDPDGDDLTYEVHLRKGSNGTYTKVAEGLSDVFHLVTGLEPGNTYYWYISVYDPYGGWNSTAVRTFVVNSLPDVYLIRPNDNTTLDTTKVYFEWAGSDDEGQNLTYTLFLEKDGALSKAVDGTTDTNITLSLENQKEYRWYVIADDGHLNQQSDIWRFLIDAPVNNPPTLASTPPTTGQLGVSYTHQLLANDIDGDLITFGFIPGAPVPAAMQITPAGYITWTPTSTGLFQIGIQMSDGKDVTKFYFNITVVSPPPNKKPTISPIPDVVLKERTPLTIDLNDYVSDDGPLSEITWSLRGGDYDLFSAELNGTNLTLEANKGANGKTRVTAVAKDGDGATGENSFNITVRSDKPIEPTLLESLKALWPLFLILIIIIIVAALIAVKRASSSSGRRRKKVKKQKIETWDEMKGELYAEKRKEQLEEKPKFRGAVGTYSEDELLAEEEIDTGEEGYAAPKPPEVEASYETVYARPGAQPVFATPIHTSNDDEEEEVLEPIHDEDEVLEAEIEEGPETPTWTPAVAPEEDEAESAQREQELDDIMRRLRTEEETAYEEKKAAEIEVELEKEPLVTETEQPIPVEEGPSKVETVDDPRPPEDLSETGGPEIAPEPIPKEEPPAPETKEEPKPEEELPKAQEPSKEEKKRPNLDDILKKLKM